MSTSAYGFKERTGPSNRAAASSAPPTAPEKLKHAWKVFPDVWELISPRRAILLLGFGLMGVSLIAGACGGSASPGVANVGSSATTVAGGVPCVSG